MTITAPSTTILLFIRKPRVSSACPFPFKEKEQAEVGQSPTLCPYATATGLKAFSGNALSANDQWNGQKRIPCVIPNPAKHN